MLHEPKCHSSYLSVFITNFLANPIKNVAILRKLYIDYFLSAQNISEITDLSWSKTAIINALKNKNITRDRRLSVLPYGEKLVGEKRSFHLTEQKIITLMMNYRKSDMSIRAITELLNQKNIPARNGGKWNKTTVGDILRRELKKEGIFIFESFNRSA